MPIIDNDHIFSNDPGKFRVNGEMKRSFVSMSKWALFAAISGFILLVALMLLVGAGISQMLFIFYQMGAGFGTNFVKMVMPYYGLAALLFLGIYFFLNFYHLRFSNHMQQAINFSDQNAFEDAWRNFRNYYRLLGMYIIISIGLSLVFLVVMIIFGSMMAKSYG